MNELTFISDSAWDPLLTNSSGFSGNLSGSLFLAECIARRLRATEFAEWRTEVAVLAPLFSSQCELIYLSEDSSELRAIVGVDKTLVDFSLHRRAGAIHTVAVRISGTSMPAVKRVRQSLETLFPRAAEPVDNRVFVRFWTLTDGSGNYAGRLLDLPEWSEIQMNYPAATETALKVPLENLETVAHNGKLMLWHGPPGTGKTYALRALAREHAEHLQLDYVTDPEVMFGGQSSYLLDTILDANNDSDKWRLLVLEDADELISSDAKLRAGQGLARLLNLVDGLVGQGLRIMVLITTNEPIGAFHPAISRPGRCGSLVHFGGFSRAEAAQWLVANGVDKVPSHETTTLADLFAMRGGHELAKPTRPVGFRG